VRPIPIRLKGVQVHGYKLKPNQDRDIVLTAVGRYTQYKGYEKLVKLVANVSGFRLNIVCSSQMPENLINSIESSANIVIQRNLDDSELENLLVSTHVFVLSSISRNEGFGIVLLEALRLGIPICVNKIEGTGSEFITKPGVNGEFFHIDEPKSFYEAIGQITNESRYEDYCKEALNDFNSRFRSNDSYEFLEVLDSLVHTAL